jgi:WD40 repeat protein
MPPQPSSIKKTKETLRKDILLSVARVPNTSRLYVGSSDAKVYELDLSQPKPEVGEFAGHQSYVTGVALAGDVLVSGSYDQNLIWWDREKRTPIRTVENAHARWIRAVVASPDGSLVASIADDMVCRVWDAKTGEKRFELRGHEEKTPTHFRSMLHCCCFSPDGKLLATADKVGHIVVWDTATGKPMKTLEAPGLYTWDPVQRLHSIGGVRSLAFSADGKLLAAGGIAKIGNIDHLDAPARVEIFDWAKGERTHEMQAGTKGIINALVFHPQADWLMGLGGPADFVLFFDLKAKKLMHETKSGMFVHAAVVDETMETVYAVGHNKAVVMEMKG